MALDTEARIVATAAISTADLACFDAQLRALVPSGVVAIDGPTGPSVGAYVHDTNVSKKFRYARGCEVELGRQRKIWVSFATGTDPLTGWMAVSQSVHEHTESAGFRALETYPYAVYSTLLGSRPAKKTSATGARQRVQLLRDAGIDDPHLSMWSHDGLDAAAAALVALHAYRGTADSIVSLLDNTAIWLPAPLNISRE